ncbi:iron-containing redox enzyme family protein [Saccharomonospora sp. NPDC006951]
MTGVAVGAEERGAVLPDARGPVSAAVLGALRDSAAESAFPLAEARRSNPYGDDLQLALHCCYELHYRGFAGACGDWEWDPGLLRLRGVLEAVFLGALRSDVGGGADADRAVESLLVEPIDGHGVSHYLRDHGQWWHMREYLALRSIYHHKEADPHAWVIPRLQGKAKAALVSVEFDEFGGGRAERMHSRLYTDLLAVTGLRTGYLHYLDQAPAEMLAVVNLMSLCGLHRSLRGALVGHFAAAEITTAPTAQRLDIALRRLGLSEQDRVFYTEHIEADAVHEQIMRHDVIGDLLATEPELAADVVFGIQATEHLEARFADRVLRSWTNERTAFRSAPVTS